MRSSPLLLLLSLAAGCSAAESLPGPGLYQQIRVQGAQLSAGPIGSDQGGPAVSQVLRPQPEISRGEAGVGLNGRLAPGGVALHLQAEGDPDHWILPANGFDFVVQDELTFSSNLDVSHSVQSETITLRLAASDREGRLGPITETTLTLLPDTPPAILHISLGWDRAVDLDLHVVDANGVAIGAKNIAAYEPPAGQVPDPDAYKEGGFLDYDSNQHCELDLRNRENMIWLQDPPAGEYRVYAHLFSPCAERVVNFESVAQLRGEVIGRARATQYDFDAREHDTEDRPPGLLLMTVQVP